MILTLLHIMALISMALYFGSMNVRNPLWKKVNKMNLLFIINLIVFKIYTVETHTQIGWINLFSRTSFQSLILSNFAVVYV